MAIITDLLNNITGLSFRTTLNNNFDNLNNDKAETTVTDALDTRLTTAETQVGTNITNITTLQSDVSTLSSTQDELHTLKYTLVTNNTATTDAWTDIINTTYTGLTAGTYKLSLNMLWTLDSTVNSASFRFSIDGGSTWVTTRKEAKDVTDINDSSYNKILVVSGTTQPVQIQAIKANGADTLTIHELSSILERAE